MWRLAILVLLAWLLLLLITWIVVQASARRRLRSLEAESFSEEEDSVREFSLVGGPKVIGYDLRALGADRSRPIRVCGYIAAWGLTAVMLPVILLQQLFFLFRKPK